MKRKIILSSVIIFIGLFVLQNTKGMNLPTKEFSGPNFDFSVSHPTTLFSKENNAAKLIRQYTRFVKDVQFVDSDGLTMYAVGVFENPDQLPLQTWIDDYNPNEYGPAIEITLGNITGLLYKINAMGSPSPNFYFTHGNEVYVITGASYNQDYLNLVSSFKFKKSSLVSKLFRLLKSATAEAFGPYVLPFYTNFNITCGFGCYSGHTGTDYALPNQTPVAAATGGTAYRYWYEPPRNYGNLLAIQHTDGHRSRYAHLDSFVAADGAYVHQGQLIAYSGNSGGPWCQEWDAQGNCIREASPYHLHFETLINSGTAVDPYTQPAESDNYLWTTNPPTLAISSTNATSWNFTNSLDGWDGRNGRNKGVDNNEYWKFDPAADPQLVSPILTSITASQYPTLEFSFSAQGTGQTDTCQVFFSKTDPPSFNAGDVVNCDQQVIKDGTQRIYKAYLSNDPDYTGNITAVRIDPIVDGDPNSSNDLIFIDYIRFTNENPPPTYISGAISQDTTWYQNRVYVVQGQVSVDPGVILTIEPGVVVKFQDTGSALDVYGTLNAQGTSQNKIYFTSYYDDSVGGDTDGDIGDKRVVV